jgi:hypothetical protein
MPACCRRAPSDPATSRWRAFRCRARHRLNHHFLLYPLKRLPDRLPAAFPVLPPLAQYAVI